MHNRVYLILATAVVAVGLALGLGGGDRSLVAALLLFGCLCAFAVLAEDSPR